MQRALPRRLPASRPSRRARCARDARDRPRARASRPRERARAETGRAASSRARVAAKQSIARSSVSTASGRPRPPRPVRVPERRSLDPLAAGGPASASCPAASRAASRSPSPSSRLDELRESGAPRTFGRPSSTSRAEERRRGFELAARQAQGDPGATASGSSSKPERNCSASSKRPWSTRISASRAAGWTQRARWPASVSSRSAARSSCSAASTRPFAAETSAPQVLQNASSDTWSYVRTKLSKTWLHCCGRSVSPARSHARISVQQTSANVSRRRRLAARRRGHRLVERARPSSTDRPTPRRGRAGRAREARGRGRLAASATSSAAGRAAPRPPGRSRARNARDRAIPARRPVRHREQPLGPREPAVGGRVVPPHERVLAGEPERDPRRPRELARAPESGVRPFPADDRAFRVAKPPPPAAESVEHLGRLIPAADRRLQRLPRRGPVRARERLQPLRRPRLGVHGHVRIVAESSRAYEPTERVAVPGRTKRGDP